MTAAKWRDPDPIRLATAHGLTVLLYRRRPVEPPVGVANTNLPAQPPTVMGQPLPYDDPEWLTYVEEDQEQDRQARQDAVAKQKQHSRTAPRHDDPPPAGAA